MFYFSLLSYKFYLFFQVYDIHVNGVFHASVRYSHLCTLHEKLIENFGFRLSGPDFPPKKIWRTLDSKAINERREGLAKYFQGLIQINDVARHFLLERAFLEFQVVSFNLYQNFSYFYQHFFRVHSIQPCKRCLLVFIFLMDIQ